MSAKIQLISKGQYLKFKCPGCGEHHVVIVEGPGAWEWNGSLTKATLRPSVLTRSGHHSEFYKPGESCWCTFYQKHPEHNDAEQFKCQVCHFYLTEGIIQFLEDCTHDLKGQVVGLGG